MNLQESISQEDQLLSEPSEETRLRTWLEGMLKTDSSCWKRMTSDYRLREALCEQCRELVTSAYHLQDATSLAHAHELLSSIYEIDFESTAIERVDLETQPILRELASILEDGMLQNELALVNKEALRDYPLQGDEYVVWLKRFVSQHSASAHPLYNDYMASRATIPDLSFFMMQEVSLDPRFDDILALLQIGLPARQKLELAKNYYDEMGNGNMDSMHSMLFSKVLAHLKIDPSRDKHRMLTDARASGNLSACLALGRRHKFKAIGYFGVTEYLAPRRFKHVVSAWIRNGLPFDGIEYHDAHIRIDAEHALGWMNNVIAPMVNDQPQAGFEIAMGAAIRLNSSQRYLDSILEHFTQ